MPESKLFWDQLIGYIREGTVVPVVGRDLLEVEAAGARENFYSLIAGRLAAYLELDPDGLQDAGSLHDVACAGMAKLGRRREEVYAALKQVTDAALRELSVDGEGSPDLQALPTSLVKLAQIRPLELFVTTTFDPLLERALANVRYDGGDGVSVQSYSPEDREDLDVLWTPGDGDIVYHLFGSLAMIPRYVVTEEDALEFVHVLQTDRKPERLIDRLRQSHLLILGCHFDDWLARFFLRSYQQRLLGASGTDYVADASLLESPRLLGFLEQFADRIKVYRDGGAAEFVDELHRRWMEAYPEGGGDDRKLPESRERKDFLFLSYPSEDVEVARRIHDALGKQGIDTWFDKSELEGGDLWSEEITRHIKKCKFFLPVISQATLTPERRSFRIEWDLAVKESRKAKDAFIFPILIDDTGRSERGIPEEFRAAQWMELKSEADVARLVETFKERIRELQRSARGGGR